MPVARAQVIGEPPPPPRADSKHYARGVFASGELGAVALLGRPSRYAGPGPAFGVRVGYDIVRFLALQLHAFGASLDATTPPPTSGQSFQTYLYTGELRLSLPLGRFSIFFEGGAGLAQVSSNVLDSVGVTRGHTFSLAALGGAGLDYHTLNRHFSFGLGADFFWLQAFSNAPGLLVDAYLRYTK
jgi:hypothetical protein